jgi:hypothetical protein
LDLSHFPHLVEISTLARTIAHEIGHLLNNSILDDHETDPWHLMRDGALGSTNNADLPLNWRSGLISPSSYNADESW